MARRVLEGGSFCLFPSSPSFFLTPPPLMHTPTQTHTHTHFGGGGGGGGGGGLTYILS